MCRRAILAPTEDGTAAPAPVPIIPGSGINEENLPAFLRDEIGDQFPSVAELQALLDTVVGNQVAERDENYDRPSFSGMYS